MSPCIFVMSGISNLSDESTKWMGYDVPYEETLELWRIGSGKNQDFGHASS